MTNFILRTWLVYTILFLLLFLILSFIKWYVCVRLKNKRIFETLKNYKIAPGHLPILGLALRLAGTPTHIHNTINDYYFKYGPNFMIWLIDTVIVAIGKPEDVEKVLQSQNCVEKNPLYHFTRDFVGYGLFSAPVDIWRRNRKIIYPTFNARVLEGYQPTFRKCAMVFVNEILPKHTNKKKVDWFTIFSALNLDVVMQSSVGVDHDIQRKEFLFGRWMETSMEAIFIRMLQFLYHPGCIFYNTKLGKTMVKYQKMVHEFIDEIIIEKKKKFDDDIANNRYEYVLNENSKKTIRQTNFLNILLELNHKGLSFNNRQLRDEVTTFFIGGTDTTSISQCFLLTMLGMHQDIQAKVYEEIMTILGPDRMPTVQDVNEMQYLERCIKESMRLFSPAPIIVRSNSGGDIKISDGVIPMGASIAVNLFYLHRSELYWEEPLKYDPDRFLPDQVAKRHPYTFLPFSAGLRGCVAMRFAYMNMKTLLSVLLRKYKIHCDAYKSIDDIKLKSNMVLKPVEELKFWMEERKPENGY